MRSTRRLLKGLDLVDVELRVVWGCTAGPHMVKDRAVEGRRGVAGVLMAISSTLARGSGGAIGTYPSHRMPHTSLTTPVDNSARNGVDPTRQLAIRGEIY